MSNHLKTKLPLLTVVFMFCACASSQSISKVTVDQFKKLIVYDMNNRKAAELKLGHIDSLLSYSSKLVVIKKESNKIVVYDSKLKPISESILPDGSLLYVSDNNIIVYNPDTKVFVFNRDFIEKTDISDLQTVKDIIQAKINYNVAAGGRKDKKAFWSIFTDDYKYREIDGEIFNRNEAEQGFDNSRRGLVSLSPETKIVIDSIRLIKDTAIVYTNQHYVRTEWGNDQKTHVYVSNVTHRETWYTTADKGWLCHFLDELTEGPFSEDGKPYTTDTKGKLFARYFWDYGVEKGKERYYSEKVKNPGTKQFEENTFNNLGYSLMSKGRITDAIEVFKLNVDAYPESYNVFDSLGEAYMNAGNKEEAIKNYEKSLELNPKNDNAVQMLKKLKS